MAGAATPSSATTSTTCGVPRVSVPVLSKAMHRIRLVRSRCTPPLMSTPLRAAPASAATIETGVEITSAHGHDTTSSTSARYTHGCQSARATIGGSAPIATASAITAGV